uniref:FAS1 domain-containing protein n=1 Tax=Angiostrongylus cantonensis TaxID=6313 RepID=A0A158PB54_ANGCA
MDSESPVRTMNEVLERVNSSLWQLAKNGGVEDELGRSNITVFASSGNDNPPDDARSYVINRIVQGIHRAYDWTDETVLKTTGGGDLVISQSEDVFGSVRTFVNCVPLNSSGHRAQNGIVHVVDGDLRPADDTLLSTLEKDHRFSSFSKLLSDKLPKLLPENKNFTVFVPSEEVFSSLSDSLLKDIKAGQGCTSSFAPSHIVEGSICSSELSHHRLKSVAGSEIDVQLLSWESTNTRLEILREDITSTSTFHIYQPFQVHKNIGSNIPEDVHINGEKYARRYHMKWRGITSCLVKFWRISDAHLLLKPTRNPSWTPIDHRFIAAFEHLDPENGREFLNLWKKSTVNGSLTTNEPITVFIPSDDAFSNNEFKKLLDNSKLSDIFVKRYIVSEPLCEFDIHPHPAEIRIQTHANLNGEPLRLRKFGDDTFIDGARIECPVEESNKKIHEMAEAAKDKVCEGGKAVKEAAESGVKKVQETGKHAYDATAEKFGEARDYIGEKLHGGADVVKGK